MNNIINEKKTFLRTKNITISFKLGNKEISENVAVKVYLKEWKQYSVSSTGCAGYSDYKGLLFDFEAGSFISNTNTNTEQHKEYITGIIANKKYNCFYNKAQNKYFKKMTF
jgi:hypothetical protein